MDCRDPLLYRSKDLEDYAREIDRTKSSILLLNKADLLPPVLRTAWADYFDAQGLAYAFWSAKIAESEMENEDTEEFGKVRIASPVILPSCLLFCGVIA